MKRTKPLLTILIIIFIFSCKTEEKKTEIPFINPPLPALNPQAESFNFDAGKGDTLKYKTGSMITIPPNIWIDSAGNKVNGMVKINYREFHDAYDIFLAGVSMAYDSAGIKQNLQTAGMFDIRAFSDTAEIFMKEGSTINVRMASFDASPGYNFYSLDEKNKHWKYKGTAEPEPNENIQLMKDSIEKMKPKVIIPFDKNYFALDYWAILDVYFKVKPGGYAGKYKNNNSLKSKSEKYGLKWSGIYGTWQQLYFKGRKVFAYELVWKNISRKKIPHWVQTKKYQLQNRLIKLTHVKKNQYYLLVSEGYGDNKKTFTFKAEAVMKLKDVFKQMPEDWQAEYEITQKKIAEAEARLAAQATIFRSFDIDQTGFHNWDRVYHRTDKIYVKANFNFENRELDKSGIPIVYFVENNQSYVQIPFNDWDKLMLVPDSTAKFVAVLSETEIATFNNKEYQQLDFSALASSTEHSFNMKTQKVSSKDDFIKAMNN